MKPPQEERKFCISLLMMYYRDLHVVKLSKAPANVFFLSRKTSKY